VTRRGFSLALVFFILAGCGQALAPTSGMSTPTRQAETVTATSAPTTTSGQVIATVPLSTTQPTPDLLGNALGAPVSNISYRVPLITRHVSTAQAILEFELDQPAAGHLLVLPDGPTGLPSSQAFDGAGGLMTVANLVPANRYHAAVILDTDGGPTQPGFRGQAWGDVTFQTQPDLPGDFRVAVVGDSGFGEPVTAQLGALMATYGVDFTLHTGDLVYNLQDDPSPAAGFQTKLFAPFSPLLRSAPFYPTLGNHDLEPAAFSQGEAYGLEAFSPFIDPAMPDVRAGDGGWYAFEQRGIQFVMLNSQVAFGYLGKADETAWLADRLADTRFQTTIVVLHVPLYNAGYHILDSLPVRGAWGEMIQSAHVPLVLAGHDHNYQRFEISGRTYVISGGGSGRLYKVPGRDPSLKASAVATHFVLLTFTASAIEIQAIDLSGQVLDEATIPWNNWQVSAVPAPRLVLASAITP
jgi:hypothetical protein